MQQQGERNTFKVLLADGRNVDICTESGANAFLEAGSKSRDFLKGNVERMAEICAKRKLNARDKGDLIGLNLFFESISQYASHDVFRQHVELSTVKTWLDFVIGQIKRYTVNRNWITTGQLPTHDSKLLESCISMMSHAVPIALAFEGEFFTALADFVKARKGTGRALPSDDICDTITLIVANAHHSSRMAFDNTWTTEKSLKKLEATGILEQFLRCVTVPQAHDFSAPGLFKFLDQFQACMPFISKRLQAGEPCGDVVIAILEGKDGSRVKRPSVLNRLQTMIRFASSIDPELTHDDGIKMCRKCGKSDHSEAFQKSLMKCSRCQSAWYCSKECQKADWKTHKLMCAPTTKKDRVMAANVQQTLMNFCHRHYVDIMVKFVESCKETGLSKKDMLVELNFAANANGVVPAMQSKPDFKVAPIKDYVEGSRPAEPDWFYKNIDRTCYEHNVKGYLAAIKEKQSKLLPKQILCLMKYEGGFSCFSVCSVDPTKEMEMFSDEAFLAFKAKIDNNDDGPLSTMFGPQKLQEMKRELFRFGYGTPDLQTIRDAMDVLHSPLGRRGTNDKIRSKRKLNARDKNDLKRVNFTFASLAEYASPDVFRQHVTQSTVRAWVNSVTDQIRGLSTNHNWIVTGTLQIYDTVLLDSCLAMMRHAVPTAFAFEGEFFAALADFVKARTGTGRALPSDYICYAMTVIVSNAYHASRIMFDNKWTAEKALKKLEATGILAQFIRCATVPQSHNLAGPGLFKMLDELQECIPFISKKLQRGQPCGDVIMAILQGKDGSRVKHSALLNKLRTVMRFVSCGDRGPESDQIRLCRNCGKSDISEAFQKSLMKCSRCQQAYYCSKECQRANWKIHKKTGTPATKKEVVRCENVQQTLSTFLHRQYVHIMVKMVNTCEQTGHSKSDLLVDLDFKANENGIVPAMQANPEFKIVPTKDYIEGSRPAEPAWLREGYDRKTYEGNVKDFLSMLKESFVKLSPSQILCLMSYEGGYSIENFSMIDPTTNREICSEEAVLAFKAYMTNGNDGPLSEIFGPQNSIR